ncbi:DUF2787 family protein [Paraclostridium sordellii]|uniref:DUF2787 family protein n=1 Tax=Paraclostridium sordellii TaxID=1505 RepID=UPI0005E06F52|nr:DUF2787 family protein [Paeniclostridium sordellii]CEN83427.1 Uncharacterised protein [[Clostridium] sordellii] [Paeniclostridium sordellii]
MPKSQRKISEISEVSEKQKNILDLEKTYFEKIWNICTSKDFENDLKKIETYISNNYDLLSDTWDLKNKIKIPAERLLRYHIYTKLSNEIIGIYPSAISGDIGFITKNAIISLDAKTIDMVGNKGDTKYLQFENNQSSFKNYGLDKCSSIGYNGVAVDTYLPAFDTYDGKTLPVLTFFLSINYIDDKQTFKLNREKATGSIVLKCLPNGELSNLFDKDIVLNFKTYTYYAKKDGYSPIEIGNYNDVKEYLSDEKFYTYTKDKVNPDWEKIEGRTKKGYYCKKEDIAWFPVKRKKGNDQIYFLEAVKGGNTARVENETIKKRFDSNDNEWIGYKTTVIK